MLVCFVFLFFWFFFFCTFVEVSCAKHRRTGLETKKPDSLALEGRGGEGITGEVGEEEKQRGEQLPFWVLSVDKRKQTHSR